MAETLAPANSAALQNGVLPMVGANALAGGHRPFHGERRVRWTLPRFYARIVPRSVDPTPTPEGIREVPRGEEPANRRRPVVAVLAIAALIVGIYVQSERWQECRTEGGEILTCLVVP
jgi:hypothetical protein